MEIPSVEEVKHRDCALPEISQWFIIFGVIYKSYAVTIEPHSRVSADCFKLVILFPSVCKLHMEPFVPRKVALEVTFLGIDSAILVYIMVAQAGLPQR